MSTEPEVETLAAALFEIEHGWPLSKQFPGSPDRPKYADRARAVLASSALDAVRRKAGDERAEQAWDEGEKAGMQNHSAYQNTGQPAHVNPYRAARIARESR